MYTKSCKSSTSPLSFHCRDRKDVELVHSISIQCFRIISIHTITPEKEDWIVKIDHPFKEYIFQTWRTRQVIPA
jgi:hypothetical protein